MERILSDLLRRLGVPEHPVEHAEYDAAVPVVQRAEGVGIAAGHARHEAFIFTRRVCGYEVIGEHGSPTRPRLYGGAGFDTWLWLSRSPLARSAPEGHARPDVPERVHDEALQGGGTKDERTGRVEHDQTAEVDQNQQDPREVAQ